MTKVNEGHLKRIKYRLTGRRFIRLLKEKDVTKYEIHKALGISYRTLSNWQSENAVPSDELAIEVAKYLGLIEPDAVTLLELEEKQRQLAREINRLKGGDNKI